ncbi:MAG: T9SS type A sorting domain-containing protein [Bacteroidia bacterium]
MKSKLLILWAFLFATGLNSQTITGRMVYPFPQGQYIQQAAQLPVGGNGAYQVVNVYNPQALNANYLMRSDSFGNVLWAKRINTFQGWGSRTYNFLQTSNKNLVIPTSQHFLTYDRVINIFRCDSNGSALWHYEYSPANSFYTTEPMEIRPWIVGVSDGSFIISSQINDTTASFIHYYHLFKLSSTGTVVWSKLYEPAVLNTKQSNYKIDICANEDIVFFGNWKDTIANSAAYPVIFRVDQNGNMLWSKKYFNLQYDGIIGDGMVTSDGGYIITGTSTRIPLLGVAAFLMKTDSLGNLEWFRRYDYPSQGYAVDGRYVRETADHGYITAIEVNPGFTYLMKTDSLGHIQWVQSNSDFGVCNLQLQDSGYFMSGYSWNSNVDYTTISADNAGNVGCLDAPAILLEDSILLQVFPGMAGPNLPLNQVTLLDELSTFPLIPFQPCPPLSGDENLTPANSITVFPQPANNVFVIESSEEIQRLELVNALGQTLVVYTPMQLKVTLDTQAYPSGIYFLNIKTNLGRQQQKLLIQH